MAGIKNRNENVETQHWSVVSQRETQHGPPVLLRLPRVRIDSPHVANTEKQFTAVAEGTSASIAAPYERTPVDQRSTVANSTATTSAIAASAIAHPESQSNAKPVEAAKADVQKSWLDDWTNGVIIFLVAVVVFTTAILAIRSPSLNLGKWLPGSASQERLVGNSKTDASSNVAATTTTTGQGTTAANPSGTNTDPVALMAEKPVSNTDLRIENPPSSNSSKTSSNSDKQETFKGTSHSPSLEARELEPLDLSSAPSIPDNLETSPNSQSPLASTGQVPSTSSHEFQPSDIAGTEETEPSEGQLAAQSQSVLETQFAESEIPQLVELLKYQRAMQGGNVPANNMVGAPNAAQSAPSQMVSGPATGFSAMQVPYLQQPTNQSAPNSRMQQPGYYPQQPVYQGGNVPPGFSNGMVPAPGPYQQVLPGLIQQMGPGQQYLISPPGTQSPQSPPLNNPQYGNNLVPSSTTAPVRAPYVPIGPGIPNQQ